MSGITIPQVGLVPVAPRLLDQLRQTALTRFGRPEPAARYLKWVRSFILFHDKRHPSELGLAEVGRFLEHLAQCEKDPLRSIEQARERRLDLRTKRDLLGSRQQPVSRCSLHWSCH